jgi:hypothetical protein
LRGASRVGTYFEKNIKEKEKDGEKKKQISMTYSACIEE